MRLRKGISAVLALMIVGGMVQAGVEFAPDIARKVQDARLSKEFRETATTEAATEGNIVVVSTIDPVFTAQPTTEEATEEETTKAIEMLDKFKKLYAENMDITGWLTIEGTPIDYPVMRGHSNDDEYYLYRNFYQNEDDYGSLYVRHKADVFTPSTNFIIYGHDMKDGSMFGTLKKYKDEEYYRQHPIISFDTLYETREYEIISVFLSQVYNSEDDVFKYYEFYNASTEDEFYEFYNNVKALALYDTGVEAAYGDTFLTLSTCSYQVEDGRLVVVAKLVK
jgi:sortase B